MELEPEPEQLVPKPTDDGVATRPMELDPLRHPQWHPWSACTGIAREWVLPPRSLRHRM